MSHNTNTNTSKYGRPNTLTDFRGIHKAYRNGQTPEQLKLKHDIRQERAKELKAILDTPISIMGAIKSPMAKMAGRRTINLGSNAHINPSLYGALHFELKRKKNVNQAVATKDRTHLAVKNHGNYSSRCKYTRYSYTPKIESWGYVVNDTHLFVRIDTTTGFISKLLKSPRGYHWAIDAYGIKLQSNSNHMVEYHPDASDFMPLLVGKKDYPGKHQIVNGYCHNLVIRYAPIAIRDTLKSMVEKAKANHATALEAKARAKENAKADKELESDIKRLAKQGLMVCVKDSLSVGNCGAGTASWMGKVGITSNHADPLKVYKLGKTTEPKKVTLVIYQAIRRHLAEVRRGYSILSEHYDKYPVKHNVWGPMETANYEETNRMNGVTTVIDILHSEAN